MTTDQIHQAIEAANKARREFFADNPAVSTGIFRMCVKYNVELCFHKQGEVLRKDNNKYVLTLPKRTKYDPDYLRIAHALVHILLGHNIENMRLPINDDIADEGQQSDLFADELLMSEYTFRNVCEACRNNVNWVAYSFNVPPSIAGTRMDTLGIKGERNDRRRKARLSERMRVHARHDA